MKKQKTPHVRSTLGIWDVEKVHAAAASSTCPNQNVQSTPGSKHFLKLRRRKKVHAVVARSTFPSQNVQSIPFSEHFWKLRSPKSARRCGAKHISQSKCAKHRSVGPLLEVQMWFRVVGARDCGPCQKLAKRGVFVAISTATTTLHSTTLHYFTPQLQLQLQLQLHYCTLFYTNPFLLILNVPTYY